jgi:hypothetical protein
MNNIFRRTNKDTTGKNSSSSSSTSSTSKSLSQTYQIIGGIFIISVIILWVIYLQSTSLNNTITNNVHEQHQVLTTKEEDNHIKILQPVSLVNNDEIPPNNNNIPATDSIGNPLIQPSLTTTTTAAASETTTSILSSPHLGTMNAAGTFMLCDNPIVKNMAVDKLELLKSIEERAKWGVGIKPVHRMNEVPNRNLKPTAVTDTNDGHTSHKEQKYAVRNWWSGWAHDHERFDLMGPVVAKCKDFRILGRGDEQKRLCFPKTELPGDCVVFSIGGANQWKFEEEIAKITPCHIHTFDCTVAKPYPPDSIKKRVTFHKLCLGSKTFTNSQGEKFTDLTGLVAAAKVNRIDFLKCDIEGFEYMALETIIESSRQEFKSSGKLIFPNVISLEIHYISQMDIDWRGRDKSPGEIFAFFNYLFFRGGYIMVDRNDNPFCPHCSEIVLVKAICGGGVYNFGNI